MTTNSTKPLDAKEEAFRDAYLKTLKPYDAAIEAGYAESTAKTKAFTWVSDSKCPKNKRHLFDAIQKAKVERSERTQIDADYVLQRLVDIDQMDVIDILKEDGSFKAIADWPQVWRRYISGMDLAEIWDGRGDDRDMIGFLKKIKWPDKVKNLELIGKHVTVQAFKERVENTHIHEYEELTDEELDERIRRAEEEA